MDEDVFEYLIFRLRSDAVDCDGNGLRIAGRDLLRREGRESSPLRYALLAIEEIEERLWQAYGCKVSAAGKLRGLQVVADALNRGEVARAQIAALLLKIPDPAPANSFPPTVAKRRHEGGWLLKDWDADEHPRTGTPPNPGWFAPTDGGNDAEAQTPRSAVPIRSSEPKPTTSAEEGGPQQQVAVLTRNFNYACRALQLDPNAASEILHQLKEAAGLGGADNCMFDTETGEVYFNGESIGNLGE